MQTDELRAELADLAREVDPFPEELTAIRKRVARRRVASMSVAAVLIVGLIAGVVATTRSSGDHVRVAGHPKQVSINALPRIDAVVAFPVHSTDTAIAGVKAILDSTDAVEHYATLPREAFAVTANPGVSPDLRSFSRSFEHSVILGVHLDPSIADRIRRLTAAVGSAAVVQDYAALRLRPGSDDIDIFLAVNACQGQIDAVRVALAGDPDVESYQFYSKVDALREFRKLFHDEPALIENTTADSLPTSFRVRVHDGVVPPAFASRYARIAGVRAINAAANPFGEMPSIPAINDRSDCTPNP